MQRQHRLHSFALQRATQNGHNAVVNALLAAGTNVDFFSFSWLAESGNKDIVYVFLDHNVNIGEKDEECEGRSTLQFAIQKDQLDIVYTLLAVGADIEAEDSSDNRTAQGVSRLKTAALHYAAIVQQCLFSQLLIRWM